MKMLRIANEPRNIDMGVIVRHFHYIGWHDVAKFCERIGKETTQHNLEIRELKATINRLLPPEPPYEPRSYKPPPEASD
jgi:hypothetical protein